MNILIVLFIGGSFLLTLYLLAIAGQWSAVAILTGLVWLLWRYVGQDSSGHVRPDRTWSE